MPRSRWKATGAVDADQDYLVVASSIPTRRRTAAGRMFRGARKIRRQLDRTEGLIGYSLLADPHRNRYATLSIWADQTALDRFVTADPHHQLMSELGDVLGTSRFEQWTIRGAACPPTWAEALRRLDIDSDPVT